MIEDEVRHFARRIGADIGAFDREHPLNFRLDGRLQFCLEMRREDFLEGDDPRSSVPLDLILSLKVPLEDYDDVTLERFLSRSSAETVGIQPYTVGCSRGAMILMSDLPLEADAALIENTILKLKKQYEEIASYGR